MSSGEGLALRRNTRRDKHRPSPFCCSLMAPCRITLPTRAILHSATRMNVLGLEPSLSETSSSVLSRPRYTAHRPPAQDRVLLDDLALCHYSALSLTYF